MKNPVSASMPAEANRSDYVQWLAELKLRYRRQQLKAAVHVNRAMIEFYWELGKDISDRQLENRYGTGFYKKLSTDLLRDLPDGKGFSPTNLKYCRYFYDLYAPLFLNRQQPVDDLCGSASRSAIYRISPRLGENCATLHVAAVTPTRGLFLMVIS